MLSRILLLASVVYIFSQRRSVTGPLNLYLKDNPMVPLSETSGVKIPVFCVAVALAPDTMAPSPSMAGSHPPLLMLTSWNCQQCDCKYPFTCESSASGRALKFSEV